MDAVDAYIRASGRKIMIEYILIKDVNSNPQDAHALGKLLEGRKVSINLIPYNPTKIGTSHGFESPDDEACKEFQNIVIQYRDDEGKNLFVSLRRSSAKGRSVNGACGQLAIKNLEDFQKKKSSPESDKGVNDIEDMLGTSVKKLQRKKHMDVSKEVGPATMLSIVLRAATSRKFALGVAGAFFVMLILIRLRR